MNNTLNSSEDQNKPSLFKSREAKFVYACLAVLMLWHGKALNNVVSEEFYKFWGDTPAVAQLKARKGGILGLGAPSVAPENTRPELGRKLFSGEGDVELFETELIRLSEGGKNPNCYNVHDASHLGFSPGTTVEENLSAFKLGMLIVFEDSAKRIQNASEKVRKGSDIGRIQTMSIRLNSLLQSCAGVLKQKYDVALNPGYVNKRTRELYDQLNVFLIVLHDANYKLHNYIKSAQLSPDVQLTLKYSYGLTQPVQDFKTGKNLAASLNDTLTTGHQILRSDNTGVATENAGGVVNVDNAIPGASRWGEGRNPSAVRQKSAPAPGEPEMPFQSYQ